MSTTEFSNSIKINAELDIIHAALTPDDHALEIDVNANALGDVKAIDIDYITGIIVDGQDEAIILINIDDCNATGGDISALEVIATEGGSQINGLFAAIGINPIEQLAGVFIDSQSALNNGVDALIPFTTADPGGSNNVQIFVNDNDTITLGSNAKFEEIEFLLEITASQNINPTFEYSTGNGSWATFTPIDGTNGMRNTGLVVWLDGDIPGWVVGLASEYLIRVTRTRNNLNRAPTESIIRIGTISSGGGGEYSWNKDGDVSINNLAVDGVLQPSCWYHVTGSNVFTDSLKYVNFGSVQEIRGLIGGVSAWSELTSFDEISLPVGDFEISFHMGMVTTSTTFSAWNQFWLQNRTTLQNYNITYFQMPQVITCYNSATGTTIVKQTNAAHKYSLNYQQNISNGLNIRANSGISKLYIKKL